MADSDGSRSIDASWRLYPRARDAFGAVLDALNIQPEAGYLLLPAYVGWSSREGSGIYDPIEKRSLSTRFYRMNQDLTINVDDLRLLLDLTPKVLGLVVVHYFGRPDPRIEEIAELTRIHRVILIEDAAHAYFSAEHSSSCGNFGAATLFSLHKMFDVSEGGVLKVNSNQMASTLLSAASGQVGNAGWTKVFEEDIAVHAEARVRNYNLVARQLKGLAPSIVSLWNSLPRGTIPQSFPVLVSDTELRDRLYFGLKKEGFQVASLYHTLIDLINPVDFPVSAQISQTIFNIPLDSWMSEADFDRLGQRAADIIGKKAVAR